MSAPTGRRTSTGSTHSLASQATGSGPFRRHQRGQAIYSPSSPAAPKYRRSSNLSTIVPQSESSSNASGPLRKFRQHQVPQDEQDWAAMEPDEVFRRLPVNAVKRVESKMRADALNKQSELRSMVGTRYRDLLTSASQITTLHNSSLHLSESLKTVAKACANPSDLNTNGEPGGSEQQETDEEDVTTMLPVAAHMKLLLDAPEALYSCFARHSYLNAAFLWLLARVVKEGLSAMPDHVKAPYLPLLQKQWETLLPFRNQIVQRATEALRKGDTMDGPTATETVLAVILLDSLNLPETLDLLLDQRLKALQGILARPPSNKKEGTGRKRSNSKVGTAAAAREAAHQRENACKVLSAAIKCLLDAVDLARNVFEPRRKSGTNESPLEEACRLTATGEEIVQAPQATVQVHSSWARQRRRTRMASISLPLPHRPGVAPSNAPPVSAPRVLQSLPSSQILLRYLPVAVTSFTPFIAPSETPNLDEKLQSWQRSAIAILRKQIPGWVASVDSVADVWTLRSNMKDLLGDSAFEQEIWSALEEEWGARIQAIWTAKLDSLVKSSEVALRTAADKVRSGEETAENDPEAFMFSNITFPPAPGSSIGAAANSTAFNTFLATLRKRAAYRTPLLDSVLSELEQAAADLKADLVGLPSTLYQDYNRKVTFALDALVKAILDVLAAVGGHRDATGSIEAELFVGRVALYLVHASPFLADIAGSTDVDISNIESALLELHDNSTAQWQGKAVSSAIHKVVPIFDDHRAGEQIRASWQGTHPTQPSTQIVAALTHLDTSVAQLGVPPNVSLPVVPNLVESFVKSVDALDGWKNVQGEEEAAQAALDLAVLIILAGRDVSKDQHVQKLLSSVSMSQFKADLGAIALESLRRSQLVAYPLTARFKSKAGSMATGSNPVSGGREDKYERRGNAVLLRLGAPALATNRGVGVGTEFKSPLAVAKPGKRFNLLSIVA